MKLSDITPDISKMSDEELMELLRRNRHNRQVVKPATATRQRKESKKSLSKAKSQLDQLLSLMSAEDIEAMLDEEK